MSIAEGRAESFHATTGQYELRTRRARQRKDEVQTQTTNTATGADIGPILNRAQFNGIVELVAYGGEKASGIGRFGGEWAVQAFTTDHWISVQELPRAYPMQVLPWH
jgi:hypothetical protein